MEHYVGNTEEVGVSESLNAASIEGEERGESHQILVEGRFDEDIKVLEGVVYGTHLFFFEHKDSKDSRTSRARAS